MQHQFVIGVSGYTPFPKIGRKKLPYAKRVLKDMPTQWMHVSSKLATTMPDLVVRARDAAAALAEITAALRTFTQHFKIAGDFRMTMDSYRGSAELRHRLFTSNTLLDPSLRNKVPLSACTRRMTLNGIDIDCPQETRYPVLPAYQGSGASMVGKRWGECLWTPAAQKAALGPTAVEVAKMKETLIAMEEEHERKHLEDQNAKRTTAQAQADAAPYVRHPC